MSVVGGYVVFLMGWGCTVILASLQANIVVARQDWYILKYYRHWDLKLNFDQQTQSAKLEESMYLCNVG